MLMRHARAYSSSCSQVVLVYFHPLCRSSLAAEICKKVAKKFYFCSLCTFKVINVDTIKKHVTSACYDKQQSVPICNLFRATRASIGKISTFQGYPQYIYAVYMYCGIPL